MKRISTALLLLAASALAPGAAAAQDWNGAYVGVNLGGDFMHSHATTTTVFAPTGYFNVTSPPAIAIAGNQKLSNTGFTGGGQVGFNWTVGTDWVAGIEADFDANVNNRAISAGAVYPCCAPTTFTVTTNETTNWMFTARPRFGYLWDNWLLYATGGVALTNQKAAFLFTDTFATAHESGLFTGTNTGWTVGAGMEEGIADDWSFKLEYLYADFGAIGGTSTNLTAPAASPWPMNVFTHHASLTEHIIRLGLNYHLD